MSRMTTTSRGRAVIDPSGALARPDWAGILGAAGRRTLRRGYAQMTTNLKGGELRPRIFAMFLIIAFLLVVMLARVVTLQAVGSGDLREASVAQRMRSVPLPAERGSILDRTGRELAIPIPTRTIYADPRKIVDPVGTARAIAELLQLTPEREFALAAGMQNNTRSFMYVAREVESQTAQAVLALKLQGIGSYREEGRAVTTDGLRPLIGRTDPDGVGTGGLELQYNELLTGVDGRIRREVNSRGQSIASGESSFDPAIRGHNVLTTIDRTVQYQVDGILTQQVERLMARSGTAIVMHSRTGEIYAVSSVRRNDDGTYASNAGNLAVVEANEPGSVAKVFSVAAALEEGTVTTQSTFVVPGVQTFNKGTQWEQVIRDAYPHGTEEMSVRKILVDSSNLGTIKIAETLAPSVRREWLRQFGFGTKSALDFPGESRGILKRAEDLQGVEKFTSAYGYGYASTAVQLVAAVNVVANDGMYVAPRIVAGTIDANGVRNDLPAGDTRRVISSATAATMRTLLTDVVCYGTAGLAKIPGMSVAGKTGTAYLSDQTGTYRNEDGSRSYFASFVGFLPANDPQFTVLVSVDQPDASSRDRFGGTAAAPVFSRIGQVLITELNIRPTPGDTGCVGSRPAELGPAH